MSPFRRRKRSSFHPLVLHGPFTIPAGDTFEFAVPVETPGADELAVGMFVWYRGSLAGYDDAVFEVLDVGGFIPDDDLMVVTCRVLRADECESRIPEKTMRPRKGTTGEA